MRFRINFRGIRLFRDESDRSGRTKEGRPVCESSQMQTPGTAFVDSRNLVFARESPGDPTEMMNAVDGGNKRAIAGASYREYSTRNGCLNDSIVFLFFHPRSFPTHKSLLAYRYPFNVLAPRTWALARKLRRERERDRVEVRGSASVDGGEKERGRPKDASIGCTRRRE
ncbi:hypothetical protein PUN28_011089 [Cardiocondyla obscurior]|uniref:Uncharacterized protein n=1 Tax=Cardiocondyla obscurior TaxID=286306 RepID=A0AAW2FKL3_9HYME